MPRQRGDACAGAGLLAASSRACSVRTGRVMVVLGMREGELAADEGVERGRGQPAAQPEQAAGQDADGVAGAGPAAGNGPRDHPGHVIGGDREPGYVVRRPGVGLRMPAGQILIGPGMWAVPAIACPDGVGVQPGPGPRSARSARPGRRTCQFPPQRVAESGHGMLGGGVIDAAGHSEPAEHRGGIDDPAVPLGAHPRVRPARSAGPARTRWYRTGGAPRPPGSPRRRLPARTLRS